MIEIDLKGKAALITGGSRGIGAGVTRILAQAGAKVAFTHRPPDEGGFPDAAGSLEAELRSSGTSVLRIPAAVQDAEQMRAAVERMVEAFGTVDILVNCAGTTSVHMVADLEVEEWERTVSINLTGAFSSVKAVLPHMQKRKKGAIVLIGSAAIVAGSGGGVHYASSKAGLEGLNRGLTRELAPHGIRCNLVHPSLVDTDLLRARHPDAAKREELGGRVPIGRLGRPEDIAYLTAFLASDMASYIAAQSIYVDGGRTFCS